MDLIYSKIDEIYSFKRNQTIIATTIMAMHTPIATAFIILSHIGLMSVSGCLGRNATPNKIPSKYP